MEAWGTEFSIWNKKKKKKENAKGWNTVRVECKAMSNANRAFFCTLLQQSRKTDYIIISDIHCMLNYISLSWTLGECGPGPILKISAMWTSKKFYTGFFVLSNWSAPMILGHPNFNGLIRTIQKCALEQLWGLGIPKGLCSKAKGSKILSFCFSGGKHNLPLLPLLCQLWYKWILQMENF